MRYIFAYLATAAVFFPVDIIWIGYVAQDFYQSQLGDLMEIKLAPAIVFYLIYIAGIVVFAVAPALHRRSLAYAAIYGALFGFFCYATYDLTNLATLRGFPAGMVVPDMIWGTVLTATSATGGYLLCTVFGQSRSVQRV